ncbi:MAG: beta-ketoacyl-[acyl-carrier-protein] synthase family protein [bacterium]
MQRQRVVVTGMGCVSALGIGYDALVEKLFSGTCGIGPITLFNAENFKTGIAAEVRNYDQRDFFPEEKLTQLDRYAQFALLATKEAVETAGIDFQENLRERTAVIYGTGIGGQTTVDESYYRLYAQKNERFHPMTVSKLIPSAAASHISITYGITGPALATTSACSSSGHAIAFACMLLRSGMVDVVITGGSEACITPGNIRAWEGMRVMAKDTCRPFSKHRTGMVIGEGAGTLILETLEHAQSRGAAIVAELAGYGMSSDAFNMLQPSQEGPVRAMRFALQDAGLSADQIQYINAHGTATPQNDPTETRAIREVFGEHASRLAVSSSKSMLGHTLGAAAALEAIVTLAALQRQTAPPTANYLEPDPQCDLDYVPNTSRPLSIHAAMSNSFAFGGLNVTLIFQRYA